VTKESSTNNTNTVFCHAFTTVRILGRESFRVSHIASYQLTSIQASIRFWKATRKAPHHDSGMIQTSDDTYLRRGKAALQLQPKNFTPLPEMVGCLPRQPLGNLQVFIS